MGYGKYVGALLAVTMLAAQPCAAAEDMRHFSNSERRSAAFGGVNIRLPLGQGVRSKPTARLQLTSTHTYRDNGSGAVRVFSPSGLELGASEKGKPTLYVGGQHPAEIKKKLGIGGTTTTLLVIGGVILILAVVAASSTPPQVDFDDDEF